MMSLTEERFIIPSKLRIGFVKRSDCYDGKLSYVTYYDGINGGVKKETSWENWRDHSIDPLEVDNVPVEGLVINKPVGGCKSGWNFRRSYCRVYDPRGFEFEITIENFLWILDYCDCFVGKRLAGKFVYSWDNSGTNLVLLPINTNEYIISSKIMEKRKLITKDFKSSELKPGSLYKLKNIPFCYKKHKSSDDVGNYNNRKAFYLGEVKFAKDLGRRYETKLLFYSPAENESDIDIVFPSSIKNIEFEADSSIFPESKVKEIINKFELTAYSWKFWNNSSPFIEEFYTQDDEFEKLLKSGIKESSCFVHIDKVNNSISFFKWYVSFSKDSSIFSGIYNVLRSRYLSYIFDFSGSNLVLKERILDLGKIWSQEDHNYSVKPLNISKQHVYPDATIKDFEALDNNIIASKSIPKTLIFYKTIDGYYSDSLQRVLSSEALCGGKSLVSSDLYIHLPIRK